MKKLKLEKKYTVEVTQEDIDRGIRGSLLSCPIARAVRRTAKVKSDIEVSVSYNVAIGAEYEAALPKKAAKFIVQFDDGKSVKPLKFVLRPRETT